MAMAASTPRRLRLRFDAVGVTVNGTAGNDLIDATHTVAGQPLPTNQEDVIIGDKGRDTISGLGGNDTLNGGANADMMIGGTGNDTLCCRQPGCPACSLNIAKRSLPKLILRGVGLASNDAVG